MHPAKFTIVLLFFLLLACTKEKEPDTVAAVLKIYSEEDLKNKVLIIDTICNNEISKAKEDIKKGNISLCISYFTSKNFYYYNDSIFKQKVTHELAKFNIKPDFNELPPSTCIPRLGSGMFKTNCYQSAMKEEVLKRYKYNIIDYVKNILDKQYVLERQNEVFEFDRRDKPRYDDIDGNDPAFEFVWKLSSDFDSVFKYPVGYIPKKTSEESYSYTTASFILMKDESIKDLSMETIFQNPKNEKFRSYFENQLADFIKRQKDWVHPTYAGLVVNNRMEVSFDHK
jgi:hypothetical protein